VEAKAFEVASHLDAVRHAVLEDDLRHLTLGRCDAFRAAVAHDILPLAAVGDPAEGGGAFGTDSPGFGACRALRRARSWLRD
jgi:hypothetical protein